MPSKSESLSTLSWDSQELFLFLWEHSQYVAASPSKYPFSSFPNANHAEKSDHLLDTNKVQCTAEASYIQTLMEVTTVLFPSPLQVQEQVYRRYVCVTTGQEAAMLGFKLRLLWNIKHLVRGEHGYLLGPVNLVPSQETVPGDSAQVTPGNSLGGRKVDGHKAEHLEWGADSALCLQNQVRHQRVCGPQTPQEILLDSMRDQQKLRPSMGVAKTRQSGVGGEEDSRQEEI